MMDVDVEFTAESALTEVVAVKKLWTRPTVVTLNLTNTAGGSQDSNFELEFLFFDLRCDPNDPNCTVITPVS